MQHNIFETKSVHQKLELVEDFCNQVLQGIEISVPAVPSRDVEVRAIRDLPPKSEGFSQTLGQARLLHDLANIELQAMELGCRTLVEFPEAPLAFRHQLVEVILDEARHLQLCLEGLEALKSGWGHWPIHLGLWQATDGEDTLLDRLIIVHRYLEGSGLDAGETLLRKLNQVGHPVVSQAVKVIVEEELGHVQFGSRWFQKICQEQKLDASHFFSQRLRDMFHKIPRRLEKIHAEKRKEAGFTDKEVKTLQELRELWLSGSGNVHRYRHSRET